MTKLDSKKIKIRLLLKTFYLQGPFRKSKTPIYMFHKKSLGTKLIKQICSKWGLALSCSVQTSIFLYLQNPLICKMLCSYTVCIQNICVGSSDKTIRDVWETTKYNQRCKISTVIFSVEFILKDRSTVQ